jgi:[ribosomal protein S5]-alanine N-acetyltransferase
MRLPEVRLVIRLETDRLRFRDHVLADLEPYCVMESDPLYRWPQAVHPRAELERSFHEAWLPPKALGLYATVYRPQGVYIGRCGLYPARDADGTPLPGEACLAYYLARPYWGRGLATEAARAFVAHGFDALGLIRIEAGVNTRQAASMRVLEKVGFTRTRRGSGGGEAWHLYELRP